MDSSAGPVRHAPRPARIRVPPATVAPPRWFAQALTGPGAVPLYVWSRFVVLARRRFVGRPRPAVASGWSGREHRRGSLRRGRSGVGATTARPPPSVVHTA